MIKKSMVLYLMVMLLLIISGCGSKSSQNMLRYAVGSDPETLDPRLSTALPASNVEAQLFEGLISLDEKKMPVPATAERWEVSSDGLTYTFYIRANAKWSNGDKVTAQDFEYAWKSALNPELASSYAYQLYYLKNGERYNKKQVTAEEVGVKAVSDTVLTVELEQPTPYFLALTAFHVYYPVHKATAQNNPKWANDVQNFVSNGPFKMVNWAHNSKITLHKNEHYYDAANVKLDKIEFALVESNNTVLAMFEGKQLDMAENPPIPEIPRLLKEGKVKLFPYLGTYYYSFNVNKAPFDNPKVRRAFALAIDRQAIIDQVLRGGQKQALALVPEGVPDIAPDSDFRTVGGNYLQTGQVSEAQKLLTEAGFPGGQGLPAVTLLYNTSENHKTIAEAIQEMWKKNLGINVQLVNQEWKVFAKTVDQHDFQVTRDDWIGDYTDPMTFLELFTSDNGNNVPGYKNSAYDQLIANAKAVDDPSQRMQLLHQAEKMLFDEAIIAPLYFYNQPVLVKPYVKGFIRSSLGVMYFKNAYLEK